MASPSRSFAEGEGGSAQSQDAAAHASSREDKNKQSDPSMVAFLKRGEEILDTFTMSIRGFEAQTLQMKRLETMVLDLQKEKAEPTKGSKRKATGENESRASTAKQARLDDDTVSDTFSISDVSDISGEDVFDKLDRHMGENENFVDDNDEMMNDINSFFQTEEVLGPNISENVAQMVDSALKSSLNKEKVKAVLDRNRRPGNVQRLQVPKIDGFMWDQLKNTTKTQDAQRQKTIGQANQALVPIVRAMDHPKTGLTPNVSILRECITDCFKILTAQVAATNQLRREQIKQELMPHLRSVCEEQIISPTRLFGDNLVEQLKQTDHGKHIKLTNRQPFLGKGRGERPKDKRPYSTPTPTTWGSQQNKRANPKFQGPGQRTSKSGQMTSNNYAKTWKASVRTRYQ